MMNTSLFLGQCYWFKSKLSYMLFRKWKVYTVFPEGLILLVFFYPINLIVFYSINENKPQLLASFESVVKQFLNFFDRFLSLSPWQFRSLSKKYVISLNYDPPILEYFWKNSFLSPVNHYPHGIHILLHILYVSVQLNISFLYFSFNHHCLIYSVFYF